MRKPTRKPDPLLTYICMLMKNEELDLPRYLESAKTFTDDIIVVDRGSTESRMRYYGKLFGFELINSQLIG